MNSEYLVYALIFSLCLYVLLRAFEKFLLPKLLKPDRFLEKREAELQDEIDELKRRLSASEKKNQELEINQALLLNQLGKANAKADRLEEKVKDLTDEVKVLQKTVPITPVEVKPFQGRVLGIWPENFPIDVAAEKNAIAATGLEYEALEGEQATRMGIVDLLGQRDYSIMEIGARGGQVGIQLHNGDIAPPRWWAQLARQHNIDIFVVLANESSKPGVVNVADSLFDAGAKAVVSVDSTINDADAVRFARMFYKRLSRGIPLAKAVEYAKLVISDQGSETIKLRERQ
jgi:hypothetical protein